MADSKPPQKRPEPRDENVIFRVPPEFKEKAKKRAAEEGRSLSAILRSFLVRWADHETPADWTPARLPGETTRAKKRKRKPRKKKRTQ